MTERSLQITYRKGHPFAAYLYLSRVTGERSARSQASADGLLIVDFARDGRPIAIEITSPGVVRLETTFWVTWRSSRCRKRNSLLCELPGRPEEEHTRLSEE